MDIEDYSVQYLDIFREELIQSGGEYSFNISYINDKLSEMRFYLNTIEDFIESQKQKEIDQLEKYAHDLTDEQRALFWAWHYPVHWDNIFANNLRSSFLVSLISFFESQLDNVCRDVKIIVRSPIKSSDLRGSVLERAEMFLRSFGNFAKPSKKDWRLMINIYDVRNVLVHNGGCIYDYNNAKRLKQFVAKQAALSIINDYIELKKDFCFYCLDIIESFFKQLRDEVLELCKRQTI